jgi:biopolymer transport protein ExbD
MGMTVGEGSEKSPGPVVNVTPLVDVTLVVLIIFMVVTPLMTKTFWLNLPLDEKKDQPPKSQPSMPLVMTVEAGGAVFVNRQPLPREEIKTRLPAMLAGASQPVLFFDAGDEVPYGDAVAVMDLARAGGARSIALVTHKVAK